MDAKKDQACPFLGLIDDPDSNISYPSQWNRCFHVTPSAPVALEHQALFCLSPDYLECEVYKGNPASLPNAIRGSQYSIDVKKNRLVLILEITLSVLILAAVFSWLSPSHGLWGLLGGGHTSGTPISNINPFPGKTTLTPIISSETPTLTPTASSTTTKVPPILFYFTPTSPSGGNSLTNTPTRTHTPVRTSPASLPTSTPIPTNPPKRPTNTPKPPTPVPTTPIPPTHTPVPPTPAPTTE